ncbi:MAG: permease [archaeon]
MFNELFRIIEFIRQSIIHIWPYLLISIPAAVAVRMSGASRYSGKIFEKSPFISILLATALGAFSPFCSCSVIPVIASLLIGGVPIAPVMSFWLASPSMDPEMFFLSVSVLGWQMAVWRISSAFLMSFMSGLITHYLVKRRWITEESTLKARTFTHVKSSRQIIREFFSRTRQEHFPSRNSLAFAGGGAAAGGCGCGEKGSSSVTGSESQTLIPEIEYSDACNVRCNEEPMLKNSCCGNEAEEKGEEINGCGCGNVRAQEKSFIKRICPEILSATSMVVKFMVLAYFLESLIVLYVPERWITSLLGGDSIISIITAALTGIPVYTSTMPALALVAGLISKGMAPAAGLAFLISGPTTTIPAMAAVWHLASRKVFFLYTGFTLTFSIISGLLYYAVY